VNLVGFTTEIYYDARSYKRQLLFPCTTFTDQSSETCTLSLVRKNCIFSYNIRFILVVRGLSRLFFKYHSMDTPLQKHVRTYMQRLATCVLSW